MEKRKFLILGHPRSGTGFMAKLFQGFGYDIGHEKMGKDGISSWMFAVEDKQVFGDKSLYRKDFTFDIVIMSMRNPLDIVCSTYYTASDLSLIFRKKHINLEGINKLEMTVKSVLEWYKIIESQKPNLKLYVDKAPEKVLSDFFKKIENRHQVAPTKKINNKVNARSHPPMNLSFIKDNCNQNLVDEFVNFCKIHGYKCE